MKRRLMLGSAALLAVSLLSPGEAEAQASNVSATKHNLSASGPGPVKVAGTQAVCKFCHTPHAANPIAPLWNRHDPGTYYETYESSTLVATVGQPTGSSRLCLSCHDGTIALTQTYNPRNAIPGTVYLTSQDRGYIGTDLSDDHPISFRYSATVATRKGELRSPSMLPDTLPLDDEGQLQCTTCHNVHDDSYGKFLRMDNQGSAMCISCHELNGWPASSHATSGASLSRSTRETWDNVPYTTVRANACENCHRPHGAGGRQRLLRREAEEDNCFACHDGTVAAKNIAAELSKPSVHPVTRTTGVHDPAEDPSTMPQHVECADCHDPHQATDSPAAQAPLLKPSMKGASGITRTMQSAAPATYEYEVCYKCHSQRNAASTPVVDRVVRDNNIAEEFSPANASYHPVEVQGKNLSVPSLLQPYRTTTIIYCTDCHGSDSGANGAKGPHGSTFRPLLKRANVTIDNTTESPAAYSLCYGCHNRASILANDSFRKHRKHIVNERTPCSVCHDPHGVRLNQFLINFDRDVVLPSKKAGSGPTFDSSTPGRVSCTLLCHGK
ncbi:MAG: hypothetical protein GWP05_00865, partial [Anaerolineaceae bacterium]|nr:hypothetical protein [Anaerolineaceae bacterium]